MSGILDFNLNGPGIVEASAGTGKTYTITAVLCRLLLGIGTGGAGRIDPEKILVMTFTEAAADDLKRKVGERFRTLRDFFEDELRELLAAGSLPGAGEKELELNLMRAYLGIPAGPDFTPDGDGRTDEIVRKLILGSRTLRNAELNLDRMQIGTIHGFCGRVIRNYAMDTGMSWGGKPGADSPELRRKALYEVIRRRFPNGEAENDALYRRFYNDYLSKGTCFKNLCEKIFAKYRDESELDSFEFGGGEDGGYFEFIHGMMREALARYDELKKEEGLITFDDMLLKLRTALVPAVGDAAEAKRRKRAFARRLANLFPVAVVDEFQDTDPVQFDIMREIYLAEPPGDGAFRGFYIVGDPKQSIYRFRGSDLNCYTEARELIRAMYPAAELPGHVISLDQNFRSDNDVVKAVNLMFSGGTDITEDPAEAGYDTAAATDFYLNSPKGGNAGTAGPAELEFTRVRSLGSKRRSRVIVRSPDGSETEDAPCNFISLDPERIQKIGSGTCREEAARECAAKITELLNRGRLKTAAEERRLKPGDFAVLVFSKTEAGSVRDALRERGVAAVFLSDRKSVYATDEFRFVSLFLKAVNESADQDYLRLVLSSFVFSPDCARFARGSAGEPESGDDVTVDSLNEVLNECRDKWSSGFMAAFTHFIEKFGVLERIRRRKYSASVLTNLMHAAEIAQSLYHGTGDLSELIERFDNLDAAGPEDADDASRIRLADDGGETVRIVTYHASKGLEYNIVMMPFAYDFDTGMGGGSEDEIGIIRAGSGRRSGDDPASGRNRNVYVRKKKDRDNPAVAADAEEDRKERHRLLYVALTRARHALYVWNLPRDCLKPGWKNKFGIDEIVAQVKSIKGNPALNPFKIDVGVRAADGEKYQGPESRAAEPRASELPAGAIDRTWRVFSYSSLVKGMGTEAAASPYPGEGAGADDEGPDPEAPAADAGARSDDIRFTFEKGSAAGTFLHEVLEKVPFREAAAEFAEFAADPEPRLADRDLGAAAHVRATRLFAQTEASLRRAGFRADDERVFRLALWLADVLGARLGDGNGTIPDLDSASLKDLDGEFCAKELEFWLRVGDSFSVARFNDLLGEINEKSLNPLEGPLPQIAREEIRGLLNGFMDLVFRHGGKYYVADYKSNCLGEDPEDYGPALVRENVKSHRYFVQYVLYTLALHRFLRERIGGYDYDRHVGGIAYLYLRGMSASGGRPGYGVFCTRISRECIEKLDALFSDKEPAGELPRARD